MRKRDFKGRCEKKKLSKCKVVCKTYDPIQSAYADILQADTEIVDIRCNVLIDSDNYTTDFVCVKKDNEIMVRECVYRTHLTKPLTIKLLDISREYWLKRGVVDWGLVINEE